MNSPSLLQPSFTICIISSLYLAFICSMSTTYTNTSSRVAYVGNSIIYFNDTPNVVDRCSDVDQIHSCCMRGGGSLCSLIEMGSNMKKVFKDGSDYGPDRLEGLLVENNGDVGENWDFVVMNDFTQSPARKETRFATLNILSKYYAPKLSKSTVILLETWGYVEEGVNASEDLGTFEEFQDDLVQGYKAYKKLLEKCNVQCRVAKVGSVFKRVKELDEDLWKRLYFVDKYHPSPLGTYLSSCVIHKTMFDTDICVPDKPEDAFENARHMSGGVLPTLADMKRVWEIAKEITK